jgi:hypothetical protein
MTGRSAFSLSFRSAFGFCGLAALAAGCSGTTEPPGSGGGSLEVTLSMAGVVPDPNGFAVSVDGGDARLLLPGGPLVFADLEPGSHVVWVSDVADHCVVEGGNPRIASVSRGETTTADIQATCNAAITAQIQVTKVAVAMVPGATETIEVRAIDETGVVESWTASIGNQAIASATALDSIVTVTGADYGTTTLTLTAASGTVRTIPVRVYDPMVLETGELLIRYATQFTCRWHDGGSGGDYDGSFYHPVTSDGFKALGSLAQRSWGCTGLDGRQWMLVVKAVPGSDALAAPTGYIREYDDAGSGASLDGSFWTPVCPAGYVPMGTVAQSGYGAPSVDDVTCVREDLTRRGEAAADFAWIDEGTGASDYLGTWPITISNLAFHGQAWLETGTFVGRGSEYSCSGEACWQRPASHPVMNVLAIDLPLLVDTPTERWVPRLTGYEQPAVVTSPLMAKTVLAPFTALLGGMSFSAGDVEWLLTHSPFVRAERQVYNKLMFHTINNTSLVQENSLELVSGVSTTNSETFSHTVGISITVESGVSFLGSGGKVSATMSYEFGYETSHSVTSLQEQHIVVTIYTPPGKAAAAWQQRNVYVVMAHNGTRLDLLAQMEFGMDTYVVDEFPNWAGTPGG